MHSIEQPIIYIALSGRAGSGKTTTGRMLSPDQPIYMDGAFPSRLWSHNILAAPIYEMVSTKRLTQGFDQDNRILYNLHDILADLLQRSLSYDDFIEFVYDVHSMDAGKEEDPKPRSFMQEIGDKARAVYEDCFVDSLIRKARRSAADEARRYTDNGMDPPFYICVVSDCRYLNELKALDNAGSIINVRLEVSKTVADQRIIERDGVPMTTEQWNHPTETQLYAALKEEDFHLVINTDELTEKEVARTIYDYVLSVTDTHTEAEYVEAKALTGQENG